VAMGELGEGSGVSATAEPVAAARRAERLGPPPAAGQRASSPRRDTAQARPHTQRPFARQVWAVLRKDLLLEWRTREVLTSSLVFGLLALVIFTFALDLRAENAALFAPGVLWAAFVFAGVLALGRSFAQERDRGTLDGLLLAPVDRSALYLAKAAANAGVILAVEAALLPVFAAFFNLPVLRLGLAPVLLLGTAGFAAVGTLFAALAANTRAREALLPVLLLPVAVPVVIGSVKATAAVLDGTAVGHWLGLLGAFDALFLVVGSWLFEHVVED
jgi:heme exporter protein B